MLLASHTVQVTSEANSRPIMIAFTTDVGVDEHAPGREIARQRRMSDRRRGRNAGAGDICSTATDG